MKLRQSNLEKLNQRVFDALIIGGGINGAVSAAALATQGASVALIDMGDFAGCTSQESSNLVWGGIKYLEGGEVGLVRKLCMSRNRLIRAYPSSVREIRFFLSLEHGFRWNRFMMFLGALLYWAIGNFFTRAPRLMDKQDINHEEPIVAPLGAGGIEYSDAFLIDNDARFVFGFIRNALDHGAIAVNYARSLGAVRREDGLWHTQVRDEIDGGELTIRSRVMINAAGPYVDEHNGRTGQTTTFHHVFSKGVHLIVPRITAAARVLTFFADDGRLFFVIPLGPKSCIGTTDTPVDSLPAQVEPADRSFILSNINRRLRLAQPLRDDDVVAERCGVRPLVQRSQTQAGPVDWLQLSRKHVIEIDADDRHISIFGGKLTDCLNIGEEIALAVRSLGVELPFYGHRWFGEPAESVRDAFFHQARLMGLDALTAKESSEPLSTRLWRRYAGAALAMLDDIRRDPRMAEVLITGTEYIRCELHQAAEREMITKLEDFLRRRSKIALIARREDIQRAPGLMQACEILFGEEARTKFDEYFADRDPPRSSAAGAESGAAASGGA
jgi:glycerol-3-phosphate dehydrogenase